MARRCSTALWHWRRRLPGRSDNWRRCSSRRSIREEHAPAEQDLPIKVKRRRCLVPLLCSAAVVTAAGSIGSAALIIAQRPSRA
jgi:hypothetical protein